ncbi:MAG: RNA polymerase sigma factor [Cytophagales bacterium]
MKTLSDNYLMAQVRDGDPTKLGLLYERYKRPLLGFYVGLVHDRELAEDLLQNTFIRILKYRHLFRVSNENAEGSDFRTWMFHIARNVKNDYYRKKKVAQEPVENWSERVGHSETRSAEMQKEDEQYLLRLAMSKLPEEKREVLLLSKYQEKKYSEIGALLGCTESAVKVKVFRALQELKVIYQRLEKSY